MTMLRGNKLGIALIIILVLAFATIIALLIWRNVELQQRVDRAETAVAELVTQNRGVQGPEGDPGRPPTAEEIAAAVAAYCDTHNGCAGPAGTPGVNGTNGADGKSIAGPAGPPGSGITRVQCNGTSISFFAGNQLVGNVAMVCIQ